MSQHDYNIANQSGASFRADMNLLLMAILSQNSGVTAPTTTTPFMLWADTANDMLKMRNSANNGWINVARLSTFGLPSVQSQSATRFTTGGSSTAFTLTPLPAIASNSAGLRFRVVFHTPPTGTPTLAVSGMGAAALKYKDLNGTKQVPTAVEIPAGWSADVEFDGTDWVILDITRPQPMTPAEILSRLLTVDGDGSGLNADMLDGLDKTSFTSWYWYWTGTLANNTTYTITLANIGGNGLIDAIPYIECVTADGNYAVGDLVPFGELEANSGRPSFTWVRNSHQAIFKTPLSLSGTAIVSGKGTAGSSFAITPARWRFRIGIMSSIV